MDNSPDLNTMTKDLVENVLLGFLPTKEKGRLAQVSKHFKGIVTKDKSYRYEDEFVAAFKWANRLLEEVKAGKRSADQFSVEHQNAFKCLFECHQRNESLREGRVRLLPNSNKDNFNLIVEVNDKLAV